MGEGWSWFVSKKWIGGEDGGSVLLVVDILVVSDVLNHSRSHGFGDVPASKGCFVPDEVGSVGVVRHSVICSRLSVASVNSGGSRARQGENSS